MRLEALADAAFDRASCSLVIPYLFDPIVTLKEIRRVLRPGATLVVSTLRRDFDPSKLYLEQAAILQETIDHAGESTQREKAKRKLNALRRFTSMVGRLIELEEDGRFRFHDEGELTELLLEAGFTDVHTFGGFGSPPAAIIALAQRRR